MSRPFATVISQYSISVLVDIICSHNDNEHISNIIYTPHNITLFLPPHNKTDSSSYEKLVVESNKQEWNCPRPAGRQSCQIISLCFLLTFCREGTSAETPLTQAWMSQRNLMDGWICYTPIKLKLLPYRKSLFLVMNLLKPVFLFLCLIFKNWMLNLMLLTFVCVWVNHRVH